MAALTRSGARNASEIVSYGKQADFKPGPFVPPPEPIDATLPLREEIEGLRRRVAESEDAASRAKREAEEHARACPWRIRNYAVIGIWNRPRQ